MPCRTPVRRFVRLSRRRASSDPAAGARPRRLVERKAAPAAFRSLTACVVRVDEDGPAMHAQTRRVLRQDAEGQADELALDRPRIMWRIHRSAEANRVTEPSP
jgi:hypothetical protein